MRVNCHLILLLQSAIRSHFTYTRYILERELYIPILQSSEFTEVIAFTFQCVPKNMTYAGTIRTERRCNTRRKEFLRIVQPF